MSVANNVELLKLPSGQKYCEATMKPAFTTKSKWDTSDVT